VESQHDFERVVARAGDGRAAVRRYIMPTVRELTPQEIQQERHLVQMSVSPPHIRGPGATASEFRSVL
jgi:hypothetical protein